MSESTEVNAQGGAAQSDPRRPWLASYPADVPPEISLDPSDTLPDFLDRCCRLYAEKPAFTSFGHRITFRQFERAVMRLSSFLQQDLGLKKGQSLALIMPNLIQYPVAVFAGLRCGLRIVNINPLYTAREILCVLQGSKAECVIALNTAGARLEELSRSYPLPHVIITETGDMLGLKGPLYSLAAVYAAHAVPHYYLRQAIPFRRALRASPLRFIKVPLTGSDVAFLQFTGGTTGKPKGAMLTHTNIIANVEQCFAMYGTVLDEGRETMLTPLPLYHVFSMTVNLMLQIRVGANSLLIMDPRRFGSLLKTIKRHPEISVMTGVNTLFSAMVDHGVFTKIPMPNLRLAIGGGAAVQSGVAERFYKASGQHILEGYGLTECSPVACVNPHTARVFTGSIGIPLPSTQARIVSLEDGREIWDLGKPGELEFKGPQVMLGYFNSEADNLKVRDGEWLRTGDIAVWQEGGYLKIVDRIKDMIIVSGFNVFPSEIEDVVSHLRKVSECCAVGVPSEKSGETIKLFIVKRDPSLTSEEVQVYCKEYLTGYKQPKLIEFVKELPKSPVGKVMRRYLIQNRYKGS
ncbi:MAG: AMP-binding protein [Succinivibrio sp.]|nr:AMP-binding protein [Succinivibrio sp.]